MPKLEYLDFRNVPKSAWPWKYFSPAEIACRDAIKAEAVAAVEGGETDRRSKAGAALMPVAWVWVSCRVLSLDATRLSTCSSRRLRKFLTRNSISIFLLRNL